MKPSLGPIDPGERLLVIDILRGVAVLGILIVNMDSYAWPLDLSRLGWADSTGVFDRLAGAFIRLFAEGKFYTLFSFLFGFGLAIQMGRAEARGAPIARLYARRLLVLLLIGLTHALLVWYGDILVTYAILGFPLLLFRHRRLKTLMIGTITCWLVAALLEWLVSGIALAQWSEDVAGVARAIQIYGHGTFGHIFAQRLRDVKVLYLVGLSSLPTVFAMFLLGLWAGRRGVFQDLGASRLLLKKTAFWGLVIGGAGNLVYVLGRDLTGETPSPLDVISGMAHVLGAPLLMLGYVASIALLVQRESWRRRLAPLAPVGRMALTNYLLQSVICTTAFYSYGLGYYARIGLAGGLLLAVVIYVVQVVLSGWWMRRFAHGPMEWLWRVLTYGQAI